MNKRAQRIVMIGDSVHRELFWSLHQFFKSLSNNNNNNANSNDKNFFQRSNDHARWNISVYNRFRSQKFTNFEDQDMIVKKMVKYNFQFDLYMHQMLLILMVVANLLKRGFFNA